MDNLRRGIYWIPEQPNFMICTYRNMYILPSDPNIEQSLNFRFLILAACSLWVFFFSFKFHFSDKDYLNINCLSGILTGDGYSQWTRKHSFHDGPITYCWGLKIPQSTNASHTVVRARKEMSKELKEKIGRLALCRKVKNSISEGVTLNLRSVGWEGGNFEREAATSKQQGDGFRQGNKSKDSQASMSVQQYQRKEGEA